MEQITIHGEISREGMLRIEVPCHLPPGPVEVMVVVRSAPSEEAQPDWRRLYGLGEEVWRGVEPLDYLRELRRDRENLP
jgi:hypothetical protein